MNLLARLRRGDSLVEISRARIHCDMMLNELNTLDKTKMLFIVCVNRKIVVQGSRGNQHIRNSGTMTKRIILINTSKDPVNVFVMPD